MAAKRKTTRKRKSAKRDKCEPIRVQIRATRELIRRLEEDLREPKLPPILRRRLQQLLAQARLRLRDLERRLRECEKSLKPK